MKTKKILFQSNINQLGKVCNYLTYSQTMNGTQIILGKENEDLRYKAEQLIYNAMRLLREIK
jgi:hypothetical protein